MRSEDSEKAIALELDKCYSLYSQYGKAPESMGLVIDSFLDVLGNYEPEYIICAFSDWRANYKKMPLPADIRGIALSKKKADKRMAEQKALEKKLMQKALESKPRQINTVSWHKMDAYEFAKNKKNLLGEIRNHFEELKYEKGENAAFEYFKYLTGELKQYELTRKEAGL